MSVVEAAVEDRLQVVLEFLVVAAVSTILRWTLTVVEARRAGKDERAFEWTKACEKLLVESNTYCKAQRPNLVIII
jgi:hypothetical protein